MKKKDMDEREINRFELLKGQALEVYKNRELSYKTEKNYQDGMMQFCKFLGCESGINKIKNFKIGDVFRFTNKMKEDGLSSGTQKLYLASLRNFVDRNGMDSRIVPSNKVLEIEKRISGKVDRSWSKKEYNDFKEIAKNYDLKNGNGGKMELILEIGKEFGCRLKGVLNLEIGDINRAINSGTLYTREKNGKVNEKNIDNLKQREVLIKIKEFALQNNNRKIFVDNNYKETYKEVQNFIGNNRKEVQSESREKSAVCRENYIKSNDISKANLTFHGLRHSFAKEQFEKLKNEGMDENIAKEKVSKMMGHNRKQVTNIYLAKSKK